MPMPQITAADVKALSKHAKQNIIDGIVNNQKAIEAGGIDTPLRLCHFMAQLAHESAHFTVTREFASGAAYEGRASLGNTQKGDGVRYRGRGLIQTTGRTNYKEATADIQKMDPSAPDFITNNTALEEFPWALIAGISFWRRHKINVPADNDDIVRVTKIINGGDNGLPDRKRYLAIAKQIWMGGAAVAASPARPAPAAGSHPLLKEGDNGPAVTALQNELIEAGFNINPDGDFGEHTKDAVKAFQEQNDLEADGIVGDATWAALVANKG